MTRYNHICILLSSVLLSFVTGCQKKDAGNSESVGIKVNELKTYHNWTSDKNLLLGLPARLKYDDKTQHLFIYDVAKQKIIEIDDNSNVVNVYGRKGRGPGEVLSIQNFFITKEHLFIVDGSQYFINKYSRRDGHYISSLDYGKFLYRKKNTSGNNIPRPPKPLLIDNNNQPFVTLDETILLPSQANGKSLYQAINWKGDKLADIGEIPKDYNATENKDKIRSALENKNVPARDLCLAFPVNDRSNLEEIFLVYSAIPKIAKYSLSGRKIWEHRIPRTPEVDSLMIDLSDVVRDHPNRPNFVMPVRKYVSGRSSPEGDLYLFTYTNLQIPNYHRPVWMHQFDSEGKLVSRYKIVSDADLFYYPGINFGRHRIFFPVVKDIGIRTYYF